MTRTPNLHPGLERVDQARLLLYRAHEKFANRHDFPSRGFTDA